MCQRCGEPFNLTFSPIAVSFQAVSVRKKSLHIFPQDLMSMFFFPLSPTKLLPASCIVGLTATADAAVLLLLLLLLLLRRGGQRHKHDGEMSPRCLRHRHRRSLQSAPPVANNLSAHPFSTAFQSRVAPSILPDKTAAAPEAAAVVAVAAPSSGRRQRFVGFAVAFWWHATIPADPRVVREVARRIRAAMREKK
jgi:hypothetical protein